MKKTLSILMVLGIFTIPPAKAQVADTMSVPFGCFEQWNNFAGDTLMLLGIPIPLNEGYSIPNGWDVPRYHVNETINYSGLAIPVSLELPVAKLWADTSAHVPEGRTGLVAETFLLSDLLTPGAYSLASSILDSTLTEQVLPSIVATGQVNLDQILPFIDLITSTMSDMSWMLDILDTADFNNYIAGGFPLNGFQPGRLIGYYKYRYDHNNPDRDNGVIIAIGTKYDPTTQRRMLVGAGSKTLFELYDTTNYEPFYMDYFPIGDYLPNDYPHIAPDSMIVMAISSAGSKGFYHGSRLFLDSLQLVQFPGPCGRLTNLRIGYHDPNRIEIRWNNSESPDRWEVQYGRSGFYLGNGTTVTVTDSNYVARDLTENTSYDFYVRGLCGDTAYTPWLFISFTTDTVTPTPQGIGKAEETHINLYPNPANGHCVVDCDGIMVEHMRLLSIDGRILQEMDVHNSKFELFLSHTSIYIIELQTPQGPIHKRLINHLK